jgi:uncharacterized protein (TIRG00374 family)
MKIKFTAGVLLSAILVYLSVRGIDFGKVAEGIHAVRGGYVLIFLVIILLMQGLRSVRWGLMLRPLGRVDPLSLFSVTSVGFLAITALPARLGELARPYLITKKSRIKMPAALGTILVERVFDSIAVLLIFATVLFSIPALPHWLTTSAVIVCLVTLAMLGVMIVMPSKRDTSLKVLSPLISRLPDRFAGKLRAMIDHLIDGFMIFMDFKLLAKVSLLSLAIWIIDVLAVYTLFFAFDLRLSFMAAAVSVIILLVGIAIPTAPGFIGNWHYACILALNLFGVSKADALSFAIVYHFLSVAMIVVLGLIFLPFNKFSLPDLKKEAASGP